MRVRLTGQQFGRRLSHPLGTITAFQPPVVQDELQQRQVIRAQVAPEEEIAPKPAVEVLQCDTKSSMWLCRGLGEADDTCCSASGILPGRASSATTGCEALETTYPHPYGWRPEREPRS